MMWWGDGWGAMAWGWMALMHMVWGVLIVGGVAALLLWALGHLFRPWRAAGEDRALEILRERYARGEISREEYEERRKVLKG
ncbi:MAG: SHOCT domain-containing protein [Bacillota bacterium]